MLGGMARLSEKLWFISENWIAPLNDNSYYTVVSYRVRFAANRIAVDLPFINSKDIFNVIFIGFPIVDFVIKLGKVNCKYLSPDFSNSIFNLEKDNDLKIRPRKKQYIW